MSLLLALTASGGAGSVTGTLALTLDGVAVASSGTLGHSGSSASTLDSISAAINGVVGHSGALGVGLDDVTVSASGTVSGGSVAITGDLAITLDDIALSATGNGGSQTIYNVYGFAPDLRSKRYRKIDLQKRLDDEAKKAEIPQAEVQPEPSPKAARNAARNAIKEALTVQKVTSYPVTYRKQEKHSVAAEKWISILVEADRAYRKHMQQIEEEDIAYVMSILATL